MLHDTDGCVDFSAGFYTRNISRSGRDPIAVPLEHRSHAAPQARINRFLEHCSDPLPDSSSIKIIWLEYDYHTLAAAQPVPSVFICADRYPQPRSDTEYRPGGLSEAAISSAASYLYGAQLSHRQAAALKRCIEMLPRRAGVIQAGFMLSRHSDAMRLCIHIERGEIAHYLKTVGWPGDRERIARLLAQYEKYIDVVRLDIDVGTEIGAYFALEFMHTTLPRIDPLFIAFLTYLVDRGICMKHYFKEILSWPGRSNCAGSIPGEPYTLWRRVSHVKVVCPSRGREIAKAYLSSHPSSGGVW
jgi:hypothetical protein